jgi:hypothetical protein
LFKKGKVKDIEQRCRLLAHQHLDIKKLFMVRSYANVEEMLVVVKEVDKVLGELGKTPFEPLKEKQEENMISNVVLKKYVTILNEYFIKIFKGAPLVLEQVHHEPIVPMCVKFVNQLVILPQCACA